MFKKIGLVGALLAALAGQASGQTPSASITKADEKALSLGYNAVEAAISDKDVRTRLFTDVAVGKGVQLGYSGLNEANKLDPQTYFGKHVITVGGKEWKTRPEVVVKTDAHGVISAQAGVKNTSIPKFLGGYGWAEANAGNDAGTVAMFYGKTLGRLGIELMHSATFPYDEKPKHYTELQPYVSVGKGYFGFARAEVDDGKLGDGAYMLGLGKKF